MGVRGWVCVCACSVVLCAWWRWCSSKPSHTSEILQLLVEKRARDSHNSLLCTPGSIIGIARLCCHTSRSTAGSRCVGVRMFWCCLRWCCKAFVAMPSLFNGSCICARVSASTWVDVRACGWAHVRERLHVRMCHMPGLLA
jgi:hypothetical protein